MGLLPTRLPGAKTWIPCPSSKAEDTGLQASSAPSDSSFAHLSLPEQIQVYVVNNGL